jgi:hypothetical protein
MTEMGSWIGKGAIEPKTLEKGYNIQPIMVGIARQARSGHHK